MAGNSDLREMLHRHFGDQMKYSGRIGLTHRSTSPMKPAIARRQTELVLRADQIRKRAKEWGPGGIDSALARRGPASRRSSTDGSR